MRVEGWRKLNVCFGSYLEEREKKMVLKILRGGLEDGDVVINLGAMLLGNAFGNPDNVSALLLLELQVRVEDSEMELLHKAVNIQLHLQAHYL